MTNDDVDIDAKDVMLRIEPINMDDHWIVWVKKYTDTAPYSMTKKAIFHCASHYVMKRAREKARVLLQQINQELTEKT